MLKKVELLIKKPLLKRVEVGKPKLTLKKVEPIKVVKPVQKPKPVEKLPDDVYKNIGEEKKMVVAVTEKTKISVGIKVTRGGDEGLPMIDIREFIESERYTGYTKKGVVVPLSEYPLFLEMLNDVLNQKEVQKAFKEVEIV